MVIEDIVLWIVRDQFLGGLVSDGYYSLKEVHKFGGMAAVSKVEIEPIGHLLYSNKSKLERNGKEEVVMGSCT